MQSKMYNIRGGEHVFDTKAEIRETRDTLCCPETLRGGDGPGGKGDMQSWGCLVSDSQTSPNSATKQTTG